MPDTPAPTRTTSPADTLLRTIASYFPEQRGRLATLRRAAGKTLAFAPDARWFYRLTSELRLNDHDDDLYFLVATLLANHRPSLEAHQIYGPGNFGTTMRALRDNGLSETSADAKMRRLLDAQPDFDGSNELGHHLHQLVKLAASRNVHINWVRLLEDVQHWNAPDRRVQKAWAKAYFRSTKPDGAPTTNDEGNTDNAD